MEPRQAIPLRDAAQHGLAGGGRACISRRQFLLTGGAVVSLAGLGGLPGLVDAAGNPISALRASYPRQRIGKLSALELGKPVHFKYPYPNIENMLVRLGVPGGGGVGAAQDVVAFNLQCSHMGGPMHGSYKEAHQVLGPCPLHLTTFDLTRHGMVVAGHATESLPQIVLETSRDDIFAVAVLGLLYGYAHNVTGARRG